MGIKQDTIPVSVLEFELNLNWCNKQDTELHFGFECKEVELK